MAISVVEMDEGQDEYPSCTGCRTRLEDKRCFQVRISNIAACLCSKCLRELTISSVDCMGRE